MGILLRNAADVAIAERTWHRKVKNRDGELVLRETPMPAAARFLLDRLADRIDDAHGTVWAGDETIAGWVHFTEAWVRKWRQPLLDMNLLELTDPPRRGKRARWRLFPELDWESVTAQIHAYRNNGRTPRKDMLAKLMAARPVTNDRTGHRDGTERELDSTDPPKKRPKDARRVTRGGGQ
ncbi:MAG: hypothetical protein ACLFWH_15115 [Actinomycetota bacterium]